MSITSDEVMALSELQDIDLELLQARKAIESLPQKEAILSIRKKRIAIKDKQIDVSLMKEETLGAIQRMEDETVEQKQKQDEAQAAINDAQGDFRAINAHAKTLDGAVKRLDYLDLHIKEQKGKLSEIETVLSQISNALRQLDAQEAEQLGSLKQQGSALLKTISDLEPKRTELADSLPSNLLATYERIAKGKCGVAVAHLNGEACGACRAKIDHAHLLQIRRQAPLSACPHCGRLLIVD